MATLRSRALHHRADWVEKDLPTLIDTTGHASLLRNLGIDVDALQSEPETETEPEAAPETAGDEADADADAPARSASTPDGAPES